MHYTHLYALALAVANARILKFALASILNADKTQGICKLVR